MRPVICALLSVVTSTCSAFAAAKVTVVLQFEDRHSEPSINEMKREGVLGCNGMLGRDGCSGVHDIVPFDRSAMTATGPPPSGP